MINLIALEWLNKLTIFIVVAERLIDHIGYEKSPKQYTVQQ